MNSHQIFSKFIVDQSIDQLRIIRLSFLHPLNTSLESRNYYCSSYRIEVDGNIKLKGEGEEEEIELTHSRFIEQEHPEGKMFSSQKEFHIRRFQGSWRKYKHTGNKNQCFELGGRLRIDIFVLFEYLEFNPIE